MALLSLERRKRYFKALGLGEYNRKNLLAFQKKAFKDKKQHDAAYGINTDRALRHFYNVKTHAPSFKPEEFRCDCGHCTGYPSWMKQVELKNLQKIRDHYKRPMIVTSGLRCKHANGASQGSIQNSLHLVGRACDFYMRGVTDTLANRKLSIKWMKKLPHTHYIYGNGINSNGYGVYAPYMGNAMHYDTYAVKTTAKAKAKTPKKTKPEKAVEWAKKIAADNSYHYVVWSKDERTHKCPICHHYKGAYKGFNCIRFVFSAWYHGGGIKCKHEGGLINNSIGQKMLNAKSSDLLKMAKKATGCDDIIVLRNRKGIKQSLLKPGDACMYFRKGIYKHMFLYAGGGKMVDSGRWKDKKKQIAVRKSLTPCIVIRYTGK